MKKYLLVVSVVAAAITSFALFAESIGVPGATLPKGKLAFDAKYSYFDREIERDLVSGIPLDPQMFRPGDITFFRDNATLRTNRVYGVISYGVYNTMEDGFLTGAEAFIALGAANAEIPNEFYGNLPTNRGTMALQQEFSEDFVGDMGFAIGGGVKATLYKNGPLSVGLVNQITHFNTEDDFTYEIPVAGLGTRFIQNAEAEITEMEIALGTSYEVDCGNLGKVTPYLGIVASMVEGNIDYDLSFSNVSRSIWYDAPASHTDVDISEDERTGVFVGVNWAITDYARVGVEGNFYGDGNGVSVGGGISF